MNLLFMISVVLTFCFIIRFIFNPLLNMKSEKSNFLKEDIDIKIFFLNKQKKELELDFDIGNIDLNKYIKEEEYIEKQISILKKSE